MRLRRRPLLAGAAALLSAGGSARAQALVEQRAYVGSTRPDGKGITLWRVNSRDGAMNLLQTFPADTPSWLARDAAGRVLYAVSESEPEGRVTAFAIDPVSGGLTPINTVGSGGSRPCYLSVHPSGRFVLVANDGGTVAVLPIMASGALQAASDVQRDPDDGTANAAPPHMRMVQSDPAGRFVLVADTGRDRLLRYTLDPATGKLAAVPPPVATTAGAAPQHFAFHPSGRIVYVLLARDGVVVVYDYVRETGALKQRQRISALPPGFAGSFLAAEIAVSPDGRFVYASLRTHDAVAIFAAAPDGRLTRIGEAWTHGEDPRSFAIASGGTTLFACNCRGNVITAFRVNRTEGALEFLGQYAPVGSPACIVFLD